MIIFIVGKVRRAERKKKGGDMDGNGATETFSGVG